MDRVLESKILAKAERRFSPGVVGLRFGLFACVGPVCCDLSLSTFVRVVCECVVPEARVVAVHLNRVCFRVVVDAGTGTVLGAERVSGSTPAARDHFYPFIPALAPGPLLVFCPVCARLGARARVRVENREG